VDAGAHRLRPLDHDGDSDHRNGSDGSDEREALEDRSPMFRIVLVQPEIPPNTGNVIRLAANTGCELHLVEPLGFAMDDPLLRRAGLDYHEYAPVRRHAGRAAWLAACAPDPARCFAFTTRGSRRLADVAWRAGDWLLFGSESSGLPPDWREGVPEDQRVRLPMRPGQRSLNLGNAVAVAVFEAWRQQGYAGAV
jgi:tRNA (cytidine/uridine-2'-O-)-methyltransferase